MINRKMHERTLNNVGKNKYFFDNYKEKNIYLYVCYQPLKKSIKKKMDSKELFNSYGEWKNYVRNKYEKYDKCSLVEFSRYLLLRIRNIKPENDYWKSLVAIFLTIFITIMCDELASLFPDLLKLPPILSFFSSLIAGCILILSTYIIIWRTITPMYEDSAEENMLIDYREIIDELIAEKNKNEIMN